MTTMTEHTLTEQEFPATSLEAAVADLATRPATDSALAGRDRVRAPRRPHLRLVADELAGERWGAPGPEAPPLLRERARRAPAPTLLPPTEVEDERGAAPTTDPRRFAAGVGLACVEVVLGRRPVGQLARWVTPEVLDLIQERAHLIRRAGVLTHARRPATRRMRVCTVDEHTAEACLVVDDGVRVRAVALRLEARRGCWRVTTLEIG